MTNTTATRRGRQIVRAIGIFAVAIAGSASSTRAQATARKVQKPAKSASPTSKWEFRQDTSAMTDDVNSHLTLRSTAPIVGPFGQLKWPTIGIQCVEGDFSAYLDSRAVVRYDASIRIRWDNEAPVSDVWPRSTDLDAVFAPHPREFVESALTAKRLRVEFPHVGGYDPIVTFDVSGLAQPFARFRSKCPAADSAFRADMADHYERNDVDERATLADSTALTTLTPELRYAHFTGYLTFIIDNKGRIRPETLSITSARDTLMFPAVREFCARLQFIPARRHGKAVAQTSDLMISAAARE